MRPTAAISSNRCLGRPTTLTFSASFARAGPIPDRAAQIFYIGYVLGTPSILLWKRVPPHILVSVLTLMWGGFALVRLLWRLFGSILLY